MKTSEKKLRRAALKALATIARVRAAGFDIPAKVTAPLTRLATKTAPTV